MANNEQDIQGLIRQAKYEGFIRHTSVSNNDKATSEKFSKYVEQDRKRENKYMGLRENILAGLKA